MHEGQLNVFSRLLYKWCMTALFTNEANWYISFFCSTWMGNLSFGVNIHTSIQSITHHCKLWFNFEELGGNFWNIIWFEPFLDLKWMNRKQHENVDISIQAHASRKLNAACLYGISVVQAQSCSQSCSAVVILENLGRICFTFKICSNTL